jgi:molybdopterin-guanine dinucleotide biosynthesis protein A
LGKSEELTVAILTGGLSLRFGFPKRKAKLGNQRLIDIAISLAQKVGDPVIIVGEADSHEFSPSHSVYPDLMPGLGPLGGIYTALIYTKSAWIAVLPCDMPNMTHEVYNLLKSQRKDNHPVVAVSHTGLEPMVSIWPKTASEIIEKRLKKGLTSPIDALETLDAIYVPLVEHLTPYNRDLFLNVNHRKDLDRANK